MTKYARFSFDLFWHNRRRMALLLLQLIFFSFVTVDVAQQIVDYVYPQTAFNVKAFEHAVYYQPDNAILDSYSVVYGMNMTGERDPYACFAQLEGLQSVEYPIEIGNKDISIVAYAAGSDMNSLLRPKMKRGKWITDSAPVQGFVRCVTMSSARKVGETFTFTTENGQDLPMVVTGICRDPYPTLVTGRGGVTNYTELLEFIDAREIAAADAEIIWISYDDIDGVQNYAKFAALIGESPNRRQLNCYLFFDPELTDAQEQHNLAVLDIDGSVFTAQSAKAMRAQRTKQFAKTDLPVVLCVWAISFIGVCFVFAVCVSESRLNFGVYRLCGAQRRQNRGICLCLSLLVIVLANVPILILLPLSATFSWFAWSSLCVPSGIICLLLLDVLIMTAALAASFIGLKKSELQEGSLNAYM